MAGEQVMHNHQRLAQTILTMYCAGRVIYKLGITVIYT
jgi:hypothetical protein